MLTYSFENIGSDLLYDYLYKCIKKDIISGKIRAGDKLPSKRSFAKNLGISVITVESAYAQLIAEGYVYSIPKSGYYISDLKNVNLNETKRILMEHAPLTGGNNSYIADFSSNQTDIEIFPFTTWAKTVREILNDSRIQLMTNPPSAGIDELREEIAAYLKAFRGMSVSAGQIVIGAGTEYLYSLLIQLLGHNSVYGVENPGYMKIARIYDSMNVKCRYIPLDENGMSVSELERSDVDVVHISPSHHFPTGKIMPISRRYEIIGWAAKQKNRYIIEDDYDSELRLSGKPIPTMQSIDVADKVIYINTFTKTLASTVRISYMVLPNSLANLFYEKLSFYSCTVSNFEQYTLARFMENGNFEKHVNKLRNYYQHKRDNILEALKNSRLGKCISIYGEDSGIHFLMTLKTRKEEDDIVKLASSAGIKLMPISYYYKDRLNSSYDKNTYVMNYSSVDISNMDKVVKALYGLI